jgi:hypothetical protein
MSMKMCPSTLVEDNNGKLTISYAGRSMFPGDTKRYWGVELLDGEKETIERAKVEDVQGLLQKVKDRHNTVFIMCGPS